MATVTKLTLVDRVFEAGVDDLAEAVTLLEGTLELIKDTLGNGEDVNVNVIAPGMVMTELAKGIGSEFLKKALDETVLGRST